MQEQERMAGLVMLAKQHLNGLEQLLGVSPYLVDAPRGTRARFWATYRLLIEEKYGDELLRLIRRAGV